MIRWEGELWINSKTLFSSFFFLTHIFWHTLAHIYCSVELPAVSLPAFGPADAWVLCGVINKKPTYWASSSPLRALGTDCSDNHWWLKTQTDARENDCRDFSSFCDEWYSWRDSKYPLTDQVKYLSVMKKRKKEHISNPSTHGTKIYSWSISQSDTATASPPPKKHLIPWFGGGSDFGM